MYKEIPETINVIYKTDMTTRRVYINFMLHHQQLNNNEELYDDIIDNDSDDEDDEDEDDDDDDYDADYEWIIARAYSNLIIFKWILT